MPEAEPLPVVRVGDIKMAEDGERWLVRSLWTNEAVGCLAGHPKLGKTWLGLEVAVAVASGTPCLGRFEVDLPGRALVYLAEDALPDVRTRVESLSRRRGIDVGELDLHVITAPRLRLDVDKDQVRLAAALEALKPRLLLLDPLVRMHQADENRASEISSMLGFLRELQRSHHVAIMLVHHCTKDRRAEPGASLRGSGDIWAFGDSYLYLSRKHEHLVLTVEHRAAPAPDPIMLDLVADDEGAHLDAVDPETTPPSGLAEDVLEILRSAEAPVSGPVMRARLRVNNNRLYETLGQLQAAGAIQRSSHGWSVPAVPPPTPAPERYSTTAGQ